MKCPECGSENVICFLNSSENFPYCKCNGCKKVFDYTDEMEQQDRLDKVLSKLGEMKWTKFRVIYVNDYFSFECNLNTIWRYLFNPSLETVESLLKDLEGYNG